ncbi:MAG TPA: hypothetical protein VIK80_11500 [Flavihumibacter sp.]|jgi:hypothetical protein
MKNYSFLLIFICLLAATGTQAQQRMSRAELQAKQAKLPHKRPAKTTADYQAALAKRKAEARQNKAQVEREDRIRQRQSQGPNRPSTGD